MSKDAYYFSHDANARNDERIISLRMMHGWEGYGIYWAIIEMLRDANAYELEMDCKRIAFALNSNEEMIDSIISCFELFKSNQEFFWSESLKRRMAIRDSKSQKARDSARVRWDKCKGNANALEAQSDGNAIKGKERKGKEIKEKKTKEEKLKVFDIFRKSYQGTKLGNEKEFLNFQKKHKDWKEILPDLSALLVCQKNEREMLKNANQFVPPWKNLQTWINNRCWEEEQAKPEGQASQKLDLSNWKPS